MYKIVHKFTETIKVLETVKTQTKITDKKRIKTQCRRTKKRID